ncbi:hypothetical protein PPERSA_11684 [Pseudocohnilembus persalinus]|uniref:Uncharacterized protein n=1 Tax=Pseudocohnilembus persalinus TaxID=266149 RepID=A0A0V0R0Y0_PSEPJ|nr:hypothetical protein PPERSA_11684 [Pseudocohnilembus persalinus]|eukprot:KRX08207.1 hypothetical protein PPERSA_11684 [Pseudocohnilembus persalinus]
MIKFSASQQLDNDFQIILDNEWNLLIENNQLITQLGGENRVNQLAEDILDNEFFFLKLMVKEVLEKQEIYSNEVVFKVVEQFENLRYRYFKILYGIEDVNLQELSKRWAQSLQMRTELYKYCCRSNIQLR